MQQLVILGSSGFIGSEIAHYFKEKTSILGIDITTGPSTQIISPIEKITHKQWKTLTTHEAAIIFAIGKTDIRGSLFKPSEDYDAFIKPLDNILNLLQDTQQRLILISSAAVYSGLDCPKKGYTENIQTKSCSMYGWHRILAEFLIEERFKNSSFHHAFAGFDIIRPFSLFGSNLKRQVIHDLFFRIQKIKLQDSFINIQGTGQEARDFIHVSAVPNLIEVFLRQQPSQRAWNLATGQRTSVHEIFEKICQFQHSSIKPIYSGEVLKPTSLIGNTQNISQLLPVSNYSLEYFLIDTLKGFASTKS